MAARVWPCFDSDSSWPPDLAIVPSSGRVEDSPRPGDSYEEDLDCRPQGDDYRLINASKVINIAGLIIKSAGEPM